MCVYGQEGVLDTTLSLQQDVMYSPTVPWYCTCDPVYLCLYLYRMGMPNEMGQVRVVSVARLRARGGTRTKYLSSPNPEKPARDVHVLLSS